MIKAIIFDWGGVLVDDPKDGLIEYCANSLNLDASVLKNVFSPYEESFQKGKISEEELWSKICSELNVEKPHIKSLWKEAARHVLKDKPQIYNLVQLLKKEGYKIGFLSNTEPPLMEYFFENKYEKYFDIITFSCAENTVKPEEKIYNLTSKKLKVNSDECIFIDDKIENINGARRVGMKGIQFKTPEHLVKELASFSINIDAIKI